MPAKGHLFWHNMSTLRFFHGAMLQIFLVWAMLLAHQTKGMVSSSPGQVQLHVEAQAEEDRQVHGYRLTLSSGTLPPTAAEPGWLPGSFASKAGGIFSRGHLVTCGQGRPRARCRSRSFVGKDGGPAGSGRSGVACRGGRWAYCGQRGLVKERCFHSAESLFRHTTSLDLIYVSLASVQGFQISLPS